MWTNLKYVSVKGVQLVRPGYQNPSLCDLVQSGWRMERVVDVWIQAL